MDGFVARLDRGIENNLTEGEEGITPHLDYYQLECQNAGEQRKTSSLNIFY